MNGQLLRVEVWTDFECAGGIRAAVLPGVNRVTETVALSGDNQLQVTVVASSAGTETIFHRRVLRLVADDGFDDEWRLSAIESGRDSNVMLELTAVDVTRELTDRCLVRRREADQTTTFQFEVVGLTLPQIVTGYILPSLAEAGQDWWSLGTVESTIAIPSFLFEWSTPMEAIKRLAQDAGVEFTRLRLGATGYQLSFPKKIGLASDAIQVRYGRNLLAGTRRVSSDNQATVIYGRGADLADGFTVDMSNATWRITNIDTASDTLTLDDGVGGVGPVGFDNQLNGMLLNGQLVVDSIAADQTVKVSDASAFALGQTVRFLDASGAPVTALSDPVQKDLYGVKIAVLQRPDLPNTHNLLPNAAMRDWPVGLAAPVGWGVDGAVTATRITDPLYTRYGGQSMKMEVNYAGAGVSLMGYITPTDASPHFSGLALIQVVSGRARVELWFTDGVTTWQRPSGGDTIACTLYTGVWESIEFAGVDAKHLGSNKDKVAIAGAVVIMQDGPTPLVCYLDGVQLTQTATQMPYFEGNGSTALWQAVNERLLLYAPPMVALSGRIVDPREFPYERLTLGGPIQQRDEELYQAVTTRIIGYTRDLTARLALNLNLSSDPADVIDVLARPRRPDPIQRPTKTFATPTITVYFADVNDAPGVLQVTLETIPADATGYYQVVARTADVPPMGDASWNVYTGSFTVQATETPMKLLVYASISGTNSSVSAYPIDADMSASLVATMSESPSGTFNLDWVPDDDTNCVDIYRVINGTGAGYPTADGSLTGALLGTAWRGWKNPQYNGGGMSAGDVNWMGGTHYSESGFSANDVVGWALVATSRKGVTADPVFGKMTMAGTVSPALTSFVQNELTVVSGFVEMNLAWTRSAAVTSSYSLVIDQQINGGLWLNSTTIPDVTAVDSVALDTGMEYSTDPADPMTTFRARGSLMLGATLIGRYVTDIQRIRTTGAL